MSKDTAKTNERPPVVAIMGHVDHGKSTLLDYIRDTNIVDGEAGGITQHISAYEITHKNESGDQKKITFLDTPGHEAFTSMRERGAAVADIAILIVSAEDSVKKQTLESLATIRKSGTPFFVAINKIDKPNANPEKVKTDLIEHEVYLEGYGGDVPFVEISAKAGTNIDELLSTILLIAELAELKGDSKALASGFVIESDMDEKRGISSTLIIKDGTLKNGMFIVVNNMLSTTRIFEDFKGETIKEATFSSPIKITGFTSPIKLFGGALTKVPKAGEAFYSFEKKKDAEKFIQETMSVDVGGSSLSDSELVTSETKLVPLIIKTDVHGTTEAVLKEISKLQTEEVAFKIIESSVGDISEKDVVFAKTDSETLIVGFNTKLDKKAQIANEQIGATIKTFTIIYELTAWLEEMLEERRPRLEIDEEHGSLKVLAFFSKTKNKQVMGGNLESGSISVNDQVKIVRRDNELGRGVVIGMQQNKLEVSSVKEGNQCGILIDSKFDIAKGDVITAFTKVVK
ncbi:MAG: translation initiation factor IF-2 [Candidatus Paceibacteria bacterium]|jgi:translation initiation factor IF-2